MTPAQCPVCHGELVVAGDDITDRSTRYWWCPYCGKPRDPAAPESMTRLPQSYVPATWRNVTPVDAEAEAIGIGFDLPSGTVRIALGVHSARQLAEALAEDLDGYRRAQSQDTGGELERNE